MSGAKKKAVISEQCVACGCCVNVCPLKVISVYKGMYAKADERRCVGCGKCVNACPAAVIDLPDINSDNRKHR